MPFHLHHPVARKWHTSIMNKREALNWCLNECKSEGLQSWWFIIMHNDVWLGCLSHHEALSGNVAGKAHYTALLQAIQCQSRSHGIHRSRHWTNWAHPTTRLFIEPLVLSIFDFKMFKHLALQMQLLQSSHFAFRLPMPANVRNVSSKSWQEQSEYLRTWKLMRFEDPLSWNGCSERPTNASAILGLEALIHTGDPCASGSLRTTAALFHGPQLFEHFRHQRSHLPGEDKQYSSGLLQHGSDLAGNSDWECLIWIRPCWSS